MSYTRAGYDWESSFKENLERSYPDAFVYKIIDTHSIEGLLRELKKRHIQYKNFLVPKVPSDFITVIDGTTHWIECKNTMNKTSFPFGNISDHQLQFGAQIEAAGGFYSFAIRKYEKKNHSAYIIPCAVMLKMKYELLPVKSIKWGILEEYAGVVKLRNRVKGTSSFDMQGAFR